MTGAIECRERRGQLPDGTGYVIQTPANWNQVLIRDLDFAQWIDEPERRGRYHDLLARGYAIAGTARHPLRQWQYDPVREISNLERVADLFERDWGRPRRLLQFGCSGGGHVSLAVSEAFHDRVDGAIAMGTHTPVWLMNTFLDGWFALKVLLSGHYAEAGCGDPADLRISGLPNDGSAHPTGHGMTGRIPQAWRSAFEAAQATAQGRARLALAFTLGQWSPWLGIDSAEPDLDDADSVQESIYQSALQVAQSPGGEARIMFENAAQGQQPSWNEGVDYGDNLRNAAPALLRAVEALYERAGLTIERDMAMINDAPRIAPSEYAQDFWKQRGRTVYGDPGIPVFRMHMVGDYQVPYSLVSGYQEALERQGRADSARLAFVKRTGHCNFSNAEISTSVDVMVRRLDGGHWPDTSPAGLNTRALTLDPDSPSAFFELGDYQVKRFNRLWLPG